MLVIRQYKKTKNLLKPKSQKSNIIPLKSYNPIYNRHQIHTYTYKHEYGNFNNYINTKFTLHNINSNNDVNYGNGIAFNVKSNNKAMQRIVDNELNNSIKKFGESVVSNKQLLK